MNLVWQGDFGIQCVSKKKSSNISIIREKAYIRTFRRQYRTTEYRARLESPQGACVLFFY